MINIIKVLFDMLKQTDKKTHTSIVTQRREVENAQVPQLRADIV